MEPLDFVARLAALVPAPRHQLRYHGTLAPNAEWRKLCMPKHGGVAPCTHCCPAAVYELKATPDAAGPIQVNFSNCVHCRTCVILDPCDVDGRDHYQNIEWRAPNEGGPKYLGL